MFCEYIILYSNIFHVIILSTITTLNELYYKKKLILHPRNWHDKIKIKIKCWIDKYGEKYICPNTKNSPITIYILYYIVKL